MALVTGLIIPIPGAIGAAPASLTSVNQRLPSGPTVISLGERPDGRAIVLMTLVSGWITPIRFKPLKANQTLPSGPTVIPLGALPGGRAAELMTLVSVWITPIRFAVFSVNQTRVLLMLPFNRLRDSRASA